MIRQIANENKTSELQAYNEVEVLPDGRLLSIRAIKADDKANLEELMRHLSPQSRFFRFLTAKDKLSDSELSRFTEIDFERQVGLMASLICQGEPVPVATGRYFKCGSADEHMAEVSFTVEEEFQGQGIGTILLRHLAGIARVRGIETFVAFVHCDNAKMLAVFRHSGLPLSESLGEQGTIELRLDLF